MIVPYTALAGMTAQTASCTRAFLSGYQYLNNSRQFRKATRQIAALKKANPPIRIHIECMTTLDPSVLDRMVRHILPQADNAGMNENELAIRLWHVRRNDTAFADDGSSSPPYLVQGALELTETLEIYRLHIHTCTGTTGSS